jgi:hypothetical protein
MSAEVAYFFLLVILLLVALLFAAYRYSQHQVHQFEEWLRIRIQAEMGLTWYATWRHLSLEQLWLQFTYDVSAVVSKGTL